MSIALLTVILFVSMLLLLLTGIPISFAIGGIAAIFAILLWGPDHLTVLVSAAISAISNINELTQQNAMGADKLATSAEHVANLAKVLNKSIDFFKS